MKDFTDGIFDYFEQMQKILDNQYAGISKAASNQQVIGAKVAKQIPYATVQSDLTKSIISSANAVSINPYAVDMVRIANSIAMPTPPSPIIVSQSPLIFYDKLNISEIVSQISNELSLSVFNTEESITQQLLSIDYLNAFCEASPIELALQNIMDMAVTIGEKEFGISDSGEKFLTTDEALLILKKYKGDPEGTKKQVSKFSEVIKLGINLVRILLEIVSLMSCTVQSATTINIDNSQSSEYREFINEGPIIINGDVNIYERLGIGEIYFLQEEEALYKGFYKNSEGEFKEFEIILPQSPSDATKESEQ